MGPQMLHAPARALWNTFRTGQYCRMWMSNAASAGAESMERTTTTWLALQLGGPFAIGLVLAARLVPFLLLGLAAGTVADRVDRTRQLLAVAGGTMLLVGGFGLLNIPGGLQVWQLIAFSFAAGCLQVFDTPARQALIMDAVPRDIAPRALALKALGRSFAAALGALAAGWLIQNVGVVNCYLAAASCSAADCLLVSGLHVAQRHRDTAAPPFGEALRGAARLIFDVPVIGTLVAAGTACEILAFSYGTALPVFAQDVLLAGPEGLGTLNAAVSIGGAIAIIILTLLPLRTRREPLLAAVFVAFGLSLLVLAATRELFLAAAVLVAVGFCGAAFDVVLQILIQLAVPEQQRGRAVGLWVLGVGSGPLGHLEMGALVGAWGAPAGLLINGALTLVAAATLITRGKSIRWW